MRVLVADDQPDVLEAARLLLKADGHVAVTAGTPRAVLQHASEQPFDLLLLDMNYTQDTTSGGEGLDLLQRLRVSGVKAPVVVMTAWGSIALAIEAMRRGAADFVEKPWDNARLLEIVGRFGSQRKQAETDIQIAQSVQQNLLGRATKAIHKLDYAGRCLPIREVGGDYFDFLDVEGEALGIALADVSGKGFAAALLMAHLQAALRSYADRANNPDALVDAINHVFWQSTSTEHYATLFYGVYERGSLRYVNAGHSAPLIIRADGAVEGLDSTGMPVGMFAAWRGEASTLRLYPGDKLVLVSDGVLEAGVQADREFGHRGIVACCARQSAADTVDRILTQAARCGAEDDMTAVVLNVL